MTLRNVDLNLLVVLDAVLSECNISRAGERMGLSQITGDEHRAGALRAIFHDPLLVRVGIALTRNADELIIQGV